MVCNFLVVVVADRNNITEVAEKFHDQIVEHMMSNGALSAYEDVDDADWHLMFDLIHTAIDDLGIL